jgi:putative ABC transport system permease protein
MWDALRLDVRHSLRSLRGAPTVSLIVVVTLALAVGATTAVGSLLNALVLRTLTVPHPEQLVALSALEPRGNVSGYFYADTFKAYRSAQRSFAQLSMYSGGGLLRVETRSGVFEDASSEGVSPDYFDIVGARASAGRFFKESDDAVVVISESFRRRVFGNGLGIGEAIKVNAVPATVIGVAADGFAGLQFDGTTDIIVPFALMRSAGGDPSRPLRSRNSELAWMKACVPADTSSARSGASAAPCSSHRSRCR